MRNILNAVISSSACIGFVTSPVLAQAPTRSGIGLLAGPQLSVTHIEGARYDPAIGGVAGLYFPTWVANRMELQPELLLSYQGSSLGSTESGRRSLHTLYAQLPITAKFYFSNVINVQVGVQIGRLRMAKTVEGDETTDVSDGYRDFEAGPTFGIGADFINGVDIGLRYYNGLTSLTDDTSLNPTFRTWRFTVGYRFWRFMHRGQR